MSSTTISHGESTKERLLHCAKVRNQSQTAEVKDYLGRAGNRRFYLQENAEAWLTLLPAGYSGRVVRSEGGDWQVSYRFSEPQVLSEQSEATGAGSLSGLSSDFTRCRSAATDSRLIATLIDIARTSKCETLEASGSGQDRIPPCGKETVFCEHGGFRHDAGCCAEHMFTNKNGERVCVECWDGTL